MIKIINSWVQGIIIAIIISTIIEIILPEGNSKKYVKVILGIYILFSIVNPIINNLTNGTVNFNSILNITNKEMEKHNKGLISIETNSYIENTYKDNLKKDIENKLKEKGYSINNINIYIDTENEERYGQINSIVLKIEKKDNIQNNDVKEIKKIEFNNNEKEVNEGISEEEINALKDYFINSYSIEKERIHINE